MSYGAVSVFIPILVLLLAAFTKSIIPSLILGILAGGILLARGNVVEGIIAAVDHLVRACANEDSLYIILFLFVFGAFAEIMSLSGGIKGFAKLADRYVKTEKGALFAVWIVSIFTSIDCCFHAISAGTVGKALVDKTQGSRHRFAHILNVTSCLLIILIPFGTTYVGYIVGVIASSLNQSASPDSAYALFIKSIPFNFYAIIMLFICAGAILFGYGFKNIHKNGSNQSNEVDPHAHEAHEQCEFEQKMPPRPYNLIVPLLLLIAVTAFFFWYTGKDAANSFGKALMNADFEKSILMASISTVLITGVFYLFQKIPLREIDSHFLSGGAEMIPPILVLMLSWGLSSIVKDLGFVDFITGTVGGAIPAFLIPALIFLIGCAASYFMGSAWGTWALLMPVAIPLAAAAQISLPLVIGAVLAGGSLGDNASPLGETAVLSAAIAEVPVMEHVRSQLPLSLAGVGISSVLFVLAALIF